MNKSFYLDHILPLAVMLLVLCGCGDSNTGNVTGKVLLNGEPLPSGMVAFLGKDGWSGSSNIKEGSYTISQVPVGDVKITVQTFPPSPAVVPPNTPAKDVPLPSLKYIAVPQQFQSTTTTPLSYGVKPGDQSHDVDIQAPGGK